MKRIAYAVFAAAMIMWNWSGATEPEPTGDSAGTEVMEDTSMAITITSTAFEDGGMIPQKHTCDSENTSPPLAWTGVPDSAVSLALICDDPDAPAKTWVHWVVYGIPPDTNSLSGGVPTDSLMANGAVQGMTDFKRVGYGGPCPPSGTHRYYFKLYALDFRPTFKNPATKDELLKAMEGHVLAEGVLMGRYKRAR